MLNSILGFFIVITIIVTIHELGHYIAARLVGVKITDFSIGFGPSLFSYKDKRGTLWKFAPILLGGYVKMLGDKNIASSNDYEKIQKLPKSLRDQSFTLQTPLNRAFIAFAGPFANYVLAFIIFVTFNFMYGRYHLPNVVDIVVENSPAMNAGLKSGDKIISVNGKSTPTFDKIYNQVSLLPNQEVDVVIERYGIEYEKIVKLSAREERDKRGELLGKVGVLGIRVSKPEIMDLGILKSIYYALDDIYSISAMTIKALAQIVKGTRPMDELRGTITVAEISGEKMNDGIISMLLYIAIISINIGFINLLPIPILDGGHIILCFYEMLFKSRPSKKISYILNLIGITIIIFMFVISTSNDIKAILL